MSAIRIDGFAEFYAVTAFFLDLLNVTEIASVGLLGRDERQSKYSSTMPYGSYSSVTSFLWMACYSI